MSGNMININSDNYPYLQGLMKQDPQKAREVLMTFIQLANEAVEQQWHELPQLFARDSLTFSDLIKGVLHGSLDLQKLNPEAYDVLKEEVHPLSMLSSRPDHLNGGERQYNWRQHFRLPNNYTVNQQSIELIFRRLLRYYKYVDVAELQKALFGNQSVTFRSMDQAKKLPYYPALRYQQEHFGDLQVGMFFDDIGYFDCGEIDKDTEICPACHIEKLDDMNEIYKGCYRCNSGFKKAE